MKTSREKIGEKLYTILVYYLTQGSIQSNFFMPVTPSFILILKCFDSINEIKQAFVKHIETQEIDICKLLGQFNRVLNVNNINEIISFLETLDNKIKNNPEQVRHELKMNINEFENFSFEVSYQNDTFVRNYNILQILISLWKRVILQKTFFKENLIRLKNNSLQKKNLD